MKKSVYSLVLMDDIVEAVDRIAYSQNTSRSNLINQILAEYLSLMTPEKRMRQVFDQMEQLFDSGGCFQIQTQPSDAMLSVRSALSFKYKPTIRYAVELYRTVKQKEGIPTVGELRVSLRTQNQQLIDTINAFFRLWQRLERGYIGRQFVGGKPPSSLDGEQGRYIRWLLLPQNQTELTSEELGQAIGGYIQMLDQVLKVYFANQEHPPLAVEMSRNTYETVLKKQPFIL